MLSRSKTPQSQVAKLGDVYFVIYCFINCYKRRLRIWYKFLPSIADHMIWKLQLCLLNFSSQGKSLKEKKRTRLFFLFFLWLFSSGIIKWDCTRQIQCALLILNSGRQQRKKAAKVKDNTCAYSDRIPWDSW